MIEKVEMPMKKTYWRVTHAQPGTQDLEILMNDNWEPFHYSGGVYHLKKHITEYVFPNRPKT